jgi:hypothetical protein
MIRKDDHTKDDHTKDDHTKDDHKKMALLGDALVLCGCYLL